MMKLSTPASSQDPSRSFIQRCSVLRRTEALPGKGRLVAVLTPYSIVGARRVSSAPDRSSARRSTMMVSQPSGRWGPCCSHVPTGTRRRASRSRMKRTSSGTRVLRCSGALTWRSRAAPRASPPPSGCTGARRRGRGRRARRGALPRCSPRSGCPPPPRAPPPRPWLPPRGPPPPPPPGPPRGAAGLRGHGSKSPGPRAGRAPSLRLGAPAGVALPCLIVGATLGRGGLQVQRIECCWPEVRAGRLPRDSSALKGTLAAAVAEARRLAERGMTAALLPRQAAFERVRDAVRSGSRTPGVERGVVILAPNGEAVAWAGRHRFVPARDTAELRAVITPFYVSLEARRQTLDGGSAVGSVLLDAVPAAPDRGRAVSAQFEAAYGVALRFYTPGLAPRELDVFDYCPISCERGDTLFSVRPVPPSQGDAKLAALRGTMQRGGTALALALVLLAIVAPAGRWRWLVVLVAAWCAARAPIGSSLHMPERSE